MTLATVKSWSDDEGWGVITSDHVPGEIFRHFSAINGPGYRSLYPGEHVTIEFEQPGQDGCEYKATKVERAWRFGAEEDVRWINDGVIRGTSITASVPPVFAAYLTLAFPLALEASRDDMRAAEDRFDDALLRVLCAHTAPQPWWLGFLETGASDVVFADAPPARV
jgi:cold shock CspA family protein